MEFASQGRCFTSVKRIKIRRFDGRITIIRQLDSDRGAALIVTTGDGHTLDITFRRSWFGIGRTIIVTGNPESPLCKAQFIDVRIPRHVVVTTRGCNGQIRSTPQFAHTP